MLGCDGGKKRLDNLKLHAIVGEVIARANCLHHDVDKRHDIASTDGLFACRGLGGLWPRYWVPSAKIAIPVRICAQIPVLQ